MSNMHVTQRAQYERIELSRPSTGVRVRRNGFVAAYTGVAVVLLAALVYAAITGIDGWAQLVVLGGIVMTTIGVMIALDPLRRG